MRPRHAARAIPVRVGQGLRSDHPLRRHDRHARRHGTGNQPLGRDTLARRAPGSHASPSRANRCRCHRPTPQKVGGRRAYDFARRDEPVELAAVPVRVSRLELLEFGDDRCRVSLTCSAGFYVRALFRDIGRAAARAPASRHSGGPGAAISRWKRRFRSTPCHGGNPPMPHGAGPDERREDGRVGPADLKLS